MYRQVRDNFSDVTPADAERRVQVLAAVDITDLIVGDEVDTNVAFYADLLFDDVMNWSALTSEHEGQLDTYTNPSKVRVLLEGLLDNALATIRSRIPAHVKVLKGSLDSRILKAMALICENVDTFIARATPRVWMRFKQLFLDKLAPLTLDDNIKLMPPRQGAASWKLLHHLQGGASSHPHQFTHAILPDDIYRRLVLLVETVSRSVMGSAIQPDSQAPQPY